MSAESLWLLEQLRRAIHKSLGSEEIADVLSALAASGHRVSVSVDAAIDEADPLLNDGSTASCDSNPLILTPSDEQFLQSMHISVENEVDYLHEGN